MQVNTKVLKLELNKLQKNISNYEEDLDNYYHELLNVSNFWHDPHEEKFSREVKLEKVKLETSLKEVKNIKDVYKYMINEYEKLGARITYDLSYKNTIIKACDNFRRKLKQIITKYENLNLSMIDEKSRILNELYKLKRVLNDVEEIKEKVKKVFDKIEDIESTIRIRLNRLDIELIRETDVREFMYKG